MNKIFLLSFLVLVLFVKAFTQNNLPSVYEIKTDTAYVNIPDSCWQMIEDADGKWTIDQVSQSPITDKFHANIDITNSNINIYWVRFSLKNNMTHEARIYFLSPTSLLDLYTKQAGSLWVHQKTGYLLPWSERDGIKNLDDIRLIIKPGQELLVYQRFKFDPRLDVPKHLYVGFGFTEQLLTNHYILNETLYFDNIRQGILFGMCLLAAIFSFFFFLTTHELVYFHASMTYLFIAVYNFASGLLDIFFRENPAVIFYGQAVIIPLWYYFLISTVRHALNTKHQYPHWHKFLLALSILPLIWMVAQYFYASLSGLLAPMAVLIFVSIIIACLRLIGKKNKTTLLLVAGVLFFAIYNTILLLAIIFHISTPTWLQKHETDIEMLCTFWLIIVSFWMLFERHRQLQKKVLQEAFEKEQIAKQKEIERRQLIEQQKVELEKQVTERTAELKQSLENLKSTQAQLIQQEKMASLGELTAGIAHEIQNPLNFLNNFSEVNIELIDELQSELKAGNTEDVFAISNDIKDNEQKILHHAKRADAIVKGMLQHSRTSTGAKEPTDINALVDEYLRLSYHGLHAKDKTVNAILQTDFDNSIGRINIVPQDIGRVFLNLFNNAFYAVSEKKKQAANEPTVSVSTKKVDNKILISVKDNGICIPQKVVDKIFQPFFTTKPTGQGTGLGLSLSYDIIKAHGGEIKVESKEGEGAEFIVQLPLTEI